MQLQYSSPSLLLSSGWAELVTSHALPGPGVINGLRGVAKTGSGCVLVVEMSSQGTLTTSEYTKGFQNLKFGFIHCLKHQERVKGAKTYSECKCFHLQLQ